MLCVFGACAILANVRDMHKLRIVFSKKTSIDFKKNPSVAKRTLLLFIAQRWATGFHDSGSHAKYSGDPQLSLARGLGWTARVCIFF